ncbi:MAG TPA: hypothetical protein P5084_08850 [Paludibacter sp.]|nr:hypothetical protein [Paludibacter sp.]
MKQLIFLLFLPLSLSLFAQNDSIEKKNLFDKLARNESYFGEFSKTGNKWNKALETVNGYPVLPFNEEDKIEYVFVEDFKSMDKTQLFTRVLEYLSITYGFIPAYLYSNQNDGKIICTQSIDITTNSKYTFSYIITIKDEKMKIEFINIVFAKKSGGYYSGDVWIPDANTTTPIEEIFPIILKPQTEWNFYLNLIRQLDDHCREEVVNLKAYIVNYQSKYSF